MPLLDHRLDDGILTITLADPARGNRLDASMDAAFMAALQSVDGATKAVLLRAEGDDFCLGRVSPMPAAGSGATAADLRRLVAEPVLALYAALRQTSVPVVAAVQGRALGVGTALVACADLAIASDTATFAVPELDRDIPPLLVMTALHARLAPAHVARLVLTRDAVTAAEALAMGLVGQVVPGADLSRAALAAVDKLRSASPLTLQTLKRFALQGAAPGFDAARTAAADMISIALAERYRSPAPC